MLDGAPKRDVQAWTIAGVLVAASLSALALDLQRERATADPQALAQAVERIRQEFRDGDAVVVRPHWDETPWAMLENMGEGTDRFPFPALLRAGELDPYVVLSRPRVWVLGTLGRPASLAASLAGDGAQALEEDLGGGVRLGRYDFEPIQRHGSLTASLGQVTATRHPPTGEAIGCPLRGDRFRCGKQAWLDPRIRTRDVFHRDVSWLYAHPGPGPATLRLHWADVPDGDALLVRIGHTLTATRREGGSPVHVRVEVDGSEVDRFVLAPYVYTLERRLFDLPGDGPHQVRFELQAQDPHRRQVMLSADVVGPLPQVVRAWAERGAGF